MLIEYLCKIKTNELMQDLELDLILQKEVEKIFGKTMGDKFDCEQLSAQISTEINEYISYQTIRRFWRLIESKNKVSLQSKNILCRYIGFNDFSTFSENIRNKHTDTYNFSFLANWQNISKYDNPLDDSVYWHNKLSQSFASFVLTNPPIFEEFSKVMNKNEVILKYIISYHPMYDNLAKEWYFRGLKLFIRNAKELHYHLFYANIQFMRCVLTMQNNDYEYFANQIETLLPKIRHKYGVIWSLEARSLSALLHYYDTLGNDEKVSQLERETLNFVQIHRNLKFEIDDYKIFVFFISDMLNIYGFHHLSHRIQEKYVFKESPSILWENGYEEAGKIVKSLTLFYQEDYTESKKIFQTIDVNKLNFDFKKYFTIQYLLLALGFCPQNNNTKRHKIRKQLTQIIDETGLIYFENFLKGTFEKHSFSTKT
ncbi:hypothetical protein [Capnocytophaga canis]|nr:hypothetical protein [Capnocytophaga canis]